MLSFCGSKEVLPNKGYQPKNKAFSLLFGRVVNSLKTALLRNVSVRCADFGSLWLAYFSSPIPQAGNKSCSVG